MNYFSAKLYRKRADGQDSFAAAYIVETSSELVKKDLARDNSILGGTAGGDLEAVPNSTGHAAKDPLATEGLLASRVARMHYFDRFGRPAGDWWYDINIRLTEMTQCPSGPASSVMGIHIWLQEEGDRSAHV